MRAFRSQPRPALAVDAVVLFLATFRRPFWWTATDGLRCQVIRYRVCVCVLITTRHVFQAIARLGVSADPCMIGPVRLQWWGGWPPLIGPSSSALWRTRKSQTAAKRVAGLDGWGWSVNLDLIHVD